MPLAMMSPDQVQQTGSVVTRALSVIEDALPWLTQNLTRLYEQLRSGRLQEAAHEMTRKFRAAYAEVDAQAQDDVGGETSPREHYTVGGAPINVGKYRSCVGCTCGDPCGAGGCACGCACGPEENP
jgi:hypothetical protein